MRKAKSKSGISRLGGQPIKEKDNVEFKTKSFLVRFPCQGQRISLPYYLPIVGTRRDGFIPLTSAPQETLTLIGNQSRRKITLKSTSFLWVRGNERADSAAKSALDLTPDKSRIPYTDLKPTINIFLHTKWQQQWSNNIHNKLFQIQPTLVEWRPVSRKSRREQVVISWLRIGHTRLTHSFILKQEPQPQCLTSQTTCTVKHILIESRAFAVIRKLFFKVNSLTDLFENVKIDDVLFFLRETELYQKYGDLKLLNLVQTNEILLIEKFTYLSMCLEIFGWIYIYIYI